jgi:hypothetical protein
VVDVLIACVTLSLLLADILRNRLDWLRCWGCRSPDPRGADQPVCATLFLGMALPNRSVLWQRAASWKALGRVLGFAWEVAALLWLVPRLFAKSWFERAITLQAMGLALSTALTLGLTLAARLLDRSLAGPRRGNSGSRRSLSTLA